MGNPTPRSQSLPRQKWATSQKWDSALAKSSRPGAIFNRHLAATEKMRSYMSGELTNIGRPLEQQQQRAYFSGELPLGHPVSPTKLPTNTAMRDAATNTDESTLAEDTLDRESFRHGSFRSLREKHEELKALERNREMLALANDKQEPEVVNGVQCFSATLQKCASAGGAPALATSVQTEKEGSHSRLLSRGGESSSFRGKQIPSLSSSRRGSSSSFRKETVSSSFRKEHGSRRKERKATKSFQDGDTSSLASESARGSPCSIHYNQGPFSAKTPPAPHSTAWASNASSPDVGFGKSSVPFLWEEAPGKAKTIAAAAEMALARKLVRDESLRRLSGISPRSLVDGHGSFRSEKKMSRGVPTEQLQPTAAPALPLPPAKRVSQEFPLPRKDTHSSQLIEELKAAVVRKQAEDLASKIKTDAEDDNKSVVSDYGSREETHIDLVAPSAAKFLTREDDLPILTPIKAPLAGVPFKWEEAPGRPKDYGPSSPPSNEPPSLSLPPRLLGGCRNPSKEQQAKILQSYSCNLMDMHWSSSGNPTPQSRSRDATPTRRDRTPTRRDKTPTKRDTTPTRRDSTPTRNYFPTRVLPKSGPITLPSVQALENVRDHFSGPLRSNTRPNYLNAPPRSVSVEFARVTQDSALMVLTQELEHATVPTSEVGSSGPLFIHRSSRKGSQELQVVRGECSASEDIDDKTASGDRKDCSGDLGKEPAAEESRALVNVGSVGPKLDPLSPTSILFCPDMSSQRSTSNLSSAYAESSHSHPHETMSSHIKSESCTSLESFVDEAYNLPPPWSGTETMESSPYRDLGPTDIAAESSQGNKSIEDGMKAIIRFCRKAKKWNRSKSASRKNSAEPDIWAPTLTTTFFPKLELGGTILSKVGSQVFPESREVKIIHLSGHLSVPCSPMKYIPRSGELTPTPEHRLGARKPLGNMTPVHVITTCRSPAYRVMATDECFSLFSVGKAWNGTKARQAKWGRKMRRSSRLMGAIFGALKRSMLLKCGKQSLPDIPSDRNLLDREADALSKEHSAKSRHDAVHSLSANHQFHRPL